MTDSRRTLRPIDGDALRDEVLRAVPFPHVLIDDFLDVDFALEVLHSLPDYADASKMGTPFRSMNERNKVQVSDSTQFSSPLKSLEESLASPDFVDVISTAFDIPDLLPDPELVGGGLHQTGPRGRLDVHVDFNYIEARRLHRRLNILVYFNQDWRPEWGGRLELWNSDVSACVHSFDPAFNRCIIFETSEISYHGVTRVACPEGIVRRSFAGYYYTVAAPAHWTGRAHSTIFKARPDESVKNRMMAVKRVTDGAKTKLKSIVRGASG